MLRSREEVYTLEFPIYPEGTEYSVPHLIDDVPEFPELTFYYLEGRNNLCPGDASVVCFWEGDLHLKLDVNGHILQLNDHDEKRSNKYQIIIGNHKYTFQGSQKYPNPGPIVHMPVHITKELISRPADITEAKQYHPSKEEYFPHPIFQEQLLRRARRSYPASSPTISPSSSSTTSSIVYPQSSSVEQRYISDELITNQPISPLRNISPLRGTSPQRGSEEVIVKRLGQPFIIELSANASTGYKWILDPLVNLKIVHSGHWSACEGPVPGCGGYDYYVLVGTKKGNTTFSGKYVRSWEPANPNDTHKTFHISIT